MEGFRTDPVAFETTRDRGGGTAAGVERWARRWPLVAVVALVTIASALCRQAVADESAGQLRARARDEIRAEKFDAALQTAQHAVELDERLHGPDDPETAASLNVLSAAYLGLGQYVRAQETAERALAIRETTRGPDDPETAESLNDLGVVFLYLKQPERAAAPIRRALAIRKKRLPADDPLIAESEGNLAAVLAGRGTTLDAKGDRQEAAAALTEAAEGFERALKIKETALGAGHPSTCATRSNLAATYLRLSKLGSGADQTRLHARAQELSAQAKSCTAAAEPGLAAAAAQINQGWALWRQNVAANARSVVVLDQMRDLFKQAATAREQVLGADHPETANALVMLATTAQAVGNYRQALELFRRALAAEDRILADFVAAGDEQQRLNLLRQAQGHYWAALSMIQRRLPKDPDAVRLGLELVLRRKGMILDVQTRVRDALSRRLDGAAAAAWQRLGERRAELSALLVKGPDPADPTSYRNRIDTLRREIEQDERTLGKQSAIVAEELAQRDVTAAAVAARLPKDSVLVEYVRIRDWDDQRLEWMPAQRYLAFVLTPDSTVRLVDLGDATAIDKALRAGFAAIEDPKAFTDPVANQKKTDAALSAVYRAIVEPLGEEARGRRVWIVSPDGEINKAPFPALRSEAGTYMVEDRLVTLVSSGRDLLRTQPGDQPPLAMLMVANPKFDSADTTVTTDTRRRRRRREAAPAAEQSRGQFRYQFGALPGTAAEAAAIRPLVRGRAEFLEDADATEPAVWDVILDRPPRILHFATHGLFEASAPNEPPDPTGRMGGGAGAGRPDDVLLRSFLALAGVNRVRDVLPNADDGVLYAAEVADMDLHGTELVVLSACQTALGDVQTGEGVYGLRRAFVLAGARNLVMSLWPVDDEETRNLMEQFYRAYGEGMSAPEALRQAQLVTLRRLRDANQRGEAAQPVAPVALWAPFVIQQSGAAPAQ